MIELLDTGVELGEVRNYYSTVNASCKSEKIRDQGCEKKPGCVLCVVCEKKNIITPPLSDRARLSRIYSQLEWIVIWLIVIEVAIELVWNILVRDVFQLIKPYGYEDD